MLRVPVGESVTIESYPRLATDGHPWITGAPTAATVRVGTPAISMPATGVAATVTTTTRTTAGFTPAGATAIEFTSSTPWVRGHRYQIEIAGYAPIDVEAERTTTGTRLRLSEPLPVPVAQGSTLRYTCVEYTLSAEQTAQAGEALALWTATIGGVDYTWSQAFRVVRRMPRPTLHLNNLTSAYPIVSTLAPRNSEDLHEVIWAAWSMLLIPRLNAKGIAEEDIISPEVLEPAHAIACVVHLLRQRLDVDLGMLDRWEQVFDRAVDNALASRWWYEVDQRETESPVPADGGPEPRRTALRMVR